MHMTRVTIPGILDMEPLQVKKYILIVKLYNIIKHEETNFLNFSNSGGQHNKSSLLLAFSAENCMTV